LTRIDTPALLLIAATSRDFRTAPLAAPCFVLFLQFKEDGLVWGKGSNAGVGGAGGPAGSLGKAPAAASSAAATSAAAAAALSPVAGASHKADDQFIGYTYKRKKDVVRSTLSSGIFTFGGPGGTGEHAAAAPSSSSGAGGTSATAATAAAGASESAGAYPGMPAIGRTGPGKVARAGSDHHAVTNGT